MGVGVGGSDEESVYTEPGSVSERGDGRLYAWNALSKCRESSFLKVPDVERKKFS